MIPAIPLPALFELLTLIVQAGFALLCVFGYRMLDSNATRGHLLIGIGSAGLVFVAPNLIFKGLSLYWVWAAARAYQKCSQKS